MNCLVKIIYFSVLGNDYAKNIVIKEIPIEEAVEMKKFVDKDIIDCNIPFYLSEFKIFKDPIIIQSVKIFFEIDTYFSTNECNFFDTLKILIQYYQYQEILLFRLFSNNDFDKQELKEIITYLINTLNDAKNSDSGRAEPQGCKLPIFSQIENFLGILDFDRWSETLHNTAHYDPHISNIICDYLRIPELEDELNFAHPEWYKLYMKNMSK